MATKLISSPGSGSPARSPSPDRARGIWNEIVLLAGLRLHQIAAGAQVARLKQIGADIVKAVIGVAGLTAVILDKVRKRAGGKPIAVRGGNNWNRAGDELPGPGVLLTLNKTK